MTGSKPLVVCAGLVVECADETHALAVAEEQAHKNQCDAFILRPVKKVAPKRDVVVTDLEAV